MSRSNYDKPFYVDVGTREISIRCASNNDIIVRYDYSNVSSKAILNVWNKELMNLAKSVCDRMNREVELSRPTRNCDLGTPEEQSSRFDAHCRKHMGCLTCPLREKDGGVPKHCEFAWSQMPYYEVK